MGPRVLCMEWMQYAVDAVCSVCVCAVDAVCRVYALPCARAKCGKKRSQRFSVYDAVMYWSAALPRSLRAAFVSGGGRYAWPGRKSTVRNTKTCETSVIFVFPPLSVSRTRAASAEPSARVPAPANWFWPPRLPEKAGE